jgi:branched-subunit amino acid ABC-type transport system permease component
LRWKLLVIASLAAALVAAFGSYGVAYVFWRLSTSPPSTLTLLLCAEIFPFAASLFIGIFVYRHTARRRKLQVVISVLFTLLLSQGLIRLLTLLLPLVPYIRSRD